MRILIVTNNLNSTDGWSRYSCDFAASLKKSGHDILFVVNKLSDKKIAKEVAILKNPLSYLSNNILNQFFAAQKMNKVIKQFAPDIVHFMVEPYASILPFLRLRSEKTVLTIHGTYAIVPLKYGLISRHLAKRYYQKIDRIVSVSNFTKKYLLDTISLGENFENKIKVINNGVNFSNYQTQAKQKENTTSNILFVGAVKPRKGLIQSIEALNEYKKSYGDNFVYNIIGHYDKEDRYFRQLANRVKELKLEKHINFRGLVSESELHQYYRDSDLFLVLPVTVDDNFEGFGLVFLEANTQGLPCLGSINAGSEEAIKDGFSGYVVDPLNPKQVAEKIDLILNQGTINSKDCIDWAEQNNIDEKTRQLIELYQKI